ncbi:AraC family transcriptional regulator [Clostridium sp. 19966]|uniref:AraC family transcriptional regulator n=1 Tax=Clostridium sp. 19966 TaxID=2768166 RepID=UPI0028DF5217|nr:AraC family transcriptional regulator [Clostridium sp. 19966]MDT8719286.1 AraC family transcriptional regulator [Clostridium sp. 19966]
MDWLKRMNRALDYVESNLMNEIDMNVVAQMACTSTYNFQKMFSFITEISLVEYIRRRRLTLSAFEIQNSDVKVIDVALKYGYESPVSFTRAFQALHGIVPSLARDGGVILKVYPRMSFQISIKGESEMEYRIEVKEAFDIFGIETIGSSIGDESYQSPSQLWKKCHKDGLYEKLFRDSGDLPSFISQDLCKIHGAVNYRVTEENTFPYMLCSFVGNNSNTQGYSIAHIPAQTYAIFPSSKFKWDEDFGSILTTLQKRFYSEWLPTSNYEKIDGAEFEIYGGTQEYGYIELWYPVVKKQTD